MMILPQTIAPKPLVPPHKLFGVEEANRAIGYVARIAHDVTVAHCQIKSIRCQLEGARGDRHEALARDCRRLANRLRELVRELDQVGVELRDFEKGAVDFPTKVNGQVVFMAWAPGQSCVQLPFLADVLMPLASAPSVLA